MYNFHAYNYHSGSIRDYKVISYIQITHFTCSCSCLTATYVLLLLLTLDLVPQLILQSIKLMLECIMCDLEYVVTIPRMCVLVDTLLFLELSSFFFF